MNKEKQQELAFLKRKAKIELSLYMRRVLGQRLQPVNCKIFGKNLDRLIEHAIDFVPISQFAHQDKLSVLISNAKRLNRRKCK